MNPKSYKRYGTKEAFGSNNLKNEMRSWSRNKMEDRKLAMKTTEVDRHAAERRKSFHYETRLVNKDLEENIIKTTPRVEEYLDRNQNRYNVWREQERVKLDRKYRSMYRDYLTEYAQLHLQDYEALERDRIRRKQTFTEKDLDVHKPEVSMQDADGVTEGKDISDVIIVGNEAAKQKDNFTNRYRGDEDGEDITVVKFRKLSLDINDQAGKEVIYTEDAEVTKAAFNKNRRMTTGSINKTDLEIVAPLFLKEAESVTEVNEEPDETNQDHFEETREEEKTSKTDEIIDKASEASETEIIDENVSKTKTISEIKSHTEPTISQIEGKGEINRGSKTPHSQRRTSGSSGKKLGINVQEETTDTRRRSSHAGEKPIGVPAEAAARMSRRRASEYAALKKKCVMQLARPERLSRRSSIPANSLPMNLRN